MARALSVKELYSKKYKLFEFDGEWLEAFGTPCRTGVWFIWGGSGNGKTSFVLKLMKYLSRFDKVLYDSLEEGHDHTIHEAFIKQNMIEVDGRLQILDRESIEDLDIRLSKQRSPSIVIIDSFQDADLSHKRFLKLVDKYAGKKLIIFISQAEGKDPAGRPAKKAIYKADLKILVEGFRAISKGRYIGTNGGIFTIWPERAAKYWGD